MRSIAVDARPLIALFDGGDHAHRAALRFFESVDDALVTNLAVITETAMMLRFSSRAVCDFLGWVFTAIEVDSGIPGDSSRIVEVITKYADLPADFADAALVAMCERRKIDRIATLDKDFAVYRLGDKKAFQNVFSKS